MKNGTQQQPKVKQKIMTDKLYAITLLRHAQVLMTNPSAGEENSQPCTNTDVHYRIQVTLHFFPPPQNDEQVFDVTYSTLAVTYFDRH